MEFFGGAQDIALPGLGDCAPFDDCLIDIRRGKPVFGSDTVGSHKAFGKVEGTQLLTRRISDDRLCDAADLAPDQIDEGIMAPVVVPASI